MTPTDDEPENETDTGTDIDTETARLPARGADAQAVAMLEPERRPPSLLTPEQRTQLVSEAETAPSQGTDVGGDSEADEAVLPPDVAARVWAGVFDFELLLRCLSPAAVKRLFSGDATTDAGELLPMQNAASDTIGFLYRGLGTIEDRERELALSVGESDIEISARRLERAVREGVIRGLAQRDTAAEAVTVTIEIDDGGPLDDYQNVSGETIPHSVAKQLLFTNRLSPEEYGTRVGEDAWGWEVLWDQMK